MGQLVVALALLGSTSISQLDITNPRNTKLSVSNRSWQTIFALLKPERYVRDVPCALPSPCYKKDSIKIHNERTPNEWPEDLILEMHEGTWSIGETKQHDCPLV